MAPTHSKSKRKALIFPLRCSCRGSKSVSVSEMSPKPRDSKPVTPTETMIFSSETPTLSSSEKGSLARDSSSSFSGLLRQLNDLEKSVLALSFDQGRSECGRLGGSVAVVKDSDDPLTDFRLSMPQMFVEMKIVGAEELRELLERFLWLNEPQHHDAIVCAFAQIWSEIFSAEYQKTA